MSKVELLEKLSDTWDVSGDVFPAAGTPAGKLEALLKYAILAPSSHNSQPWLFRIAGRPSDTFIELYADRRRALPVVDPDDRELIISCGAALFNLRIAMRHFGYKDVVELFPVPNVTDLLARVRLGKPWVASQEEHKLFHAIPARHTNRAPFYERSVPEVLLAEIQSAAQKEGAWLKIARDEEARNALAIVISYSDRLQWSDKHFRRELAAWMHSNRSTSDDGIPGYAIGMSDLASLAGPMVIRTFDMGNGQAARDVQLATGSPLLAVLGTNGDTERDWLRAGEGLARVLLLAAAEGVSASFLNQPVEITEMRPTIMDAISERGFPQIILRMGYGPEVMLTPRRPVSAVLL